MYVAGTVLAPLLLAPVVVAIIQRKDPPMHEQHTDGAAAPPHDTTAHNVEDVRRKRTGGAKEQPVEGRADEAQPATPAETCQAQGTPDGEP